MKTIAVIPACEGSIVFPNKNIRIVNGKPLIYYVINNALNSKYIDDVIVTTNSLEIINIAKQLGVKTKLRDDSLCNSITSLDVVVADVFNDISLSEYDYVITMQSISPTLKVETLDNAINLCKERDYDTVISVSSKKKFFWRKNCDEIIPIQSVRKNRNLLNPLYMETGAFLITKATYINNQSRIGKSVYLYELSDDEAVDVYCFGDLKQVENILDKKSFAIYVNGNNSIGLGHIYRVIQLADELFSKPDIYYDYNQTDKSSFGKTTHNLIGVDGVSGLFEAISNNKYDVFINDILSTTKEYMCNLKHLLPNSKIVNFEDEGDGADLADVVFNALYEDMSRTNIKAGEQYFIASKLFLLSNPINIADKVTDVFICFGGADPQNYTKRLLTIISKKEYEKFIFWVVIGKANKLVDELMSYNKYKNINVLYDINDIVNYMKCSDIAITSRGRTGFELTFLGIPTISLAQNQRETLHTFLSQKNGIEYLGLNPDDSTIEENLRKYLYSQKNFRQDLQNKMLSRDLRNGRKNVMNIIRNL